MHAADEELRALHKAAPKAVAKAAARAAAWAKLGNSRTVPSWLWEKWDFIDKSDPKYKDYFEEGTACALRLMCVYL